MPTNDLETDMLPCFKQRNIKHYMQKRYELSEHRFLFYLQRTSFKLPTDYTVTER